MDGPGHAGEPQGEPRRRGRGGEAWGEAGPERPLEAPEPAGAARGAPEGVTDDVQGAERDGGERQAPRALLEAQLLLLVLVFAHSFLKLTWALRQLNYCVAFIGAAPLKPDAAQRGRIADRYGVILSLAISSFNAGIRGYYFALAALAWLLGPIAFLAATTGMLALLIWQQFGSATAEAIRLAQTEYAAETDAGEERGRAGE